jgi:hypothetical protein
MRDEGPADSSLPPAAREATFWPPGRGRWILIPLAIVVVSTGVALVADDGWFMIPALACLGLGVVLFIPLLAARLMRVSAGDGIAGDRAER